MRALAHLIHNSLFFVLITIDFLIALLTYFSFFNCLYIVDFENFVGFSAEKVLKMWSVDAPTFVLTIRLSLLASRVLKVDGRPLHHWISTHPVSFHFLIIDWTVKRGFPVKSVISFKLFPFWCQDIIISLIAVGVRILLVLISEKNVLFYINKG